MIFFFSEISLRLEVGCDLILSFLARQPGVRAGRLGELAVGADRLDRGQLVPLADLPVVLVVRRRDLQRAGAELELHVGVLDDRNRAADEGNDHLLADHVLPARILGIDRDGGVAEHGDRTRRRDDKALAAALESVMDVIKGALALLALDLDVGQRGAAADAPIHEPLAAIDQPALPKRLEGMKDGLRASLVHREGLALPVERSAQAAQLAQDRLLTVPRPRLHAVVERLAAHGPAVDPLGLELLFHHVLRRDAAVIGARDPAGLVAGEAVVADQDVLQGVVQRVADVQRAGHVRRRDHDREGLGAGTGLRAEEARRVPRGQARGLHGLRLVGLLEHRSQRSEASAASAERSLFVNVTWPKMGWFLNLSTRFVRPFDAASR